MTHTTTITVRANPDLDDCLQGAADAYVTEHPELSWWDLSPEWSDESRETVTLTIPATSCRYQISSLDGNQVFDGGTDHDDALSTAQSHADRTGSDWYLYEQGASEDDYETVSPLRWAIVDSSSRIVSLHATRASADAAGWGHDRELVRLITSHDVGDVIEYGSDGRELVPADDLCLYDSNTADYLSAEDLGLTDEEYVQACRESRDCGQAEGHIVLASGRRVYAAE